MPSVVLRGDVLPEGPMFAKCAPTMNEVRKEKRKGQRRQHNVPVPVERRRTDRRKADRRYTLRIPIELWMEEVLGEEVYFRRSGNLGEGGVYFDKAIPHAIGTVISIKFYLPGDKETVIARGEVVNIAGSSDFGMGVKFVTVEGNGLTRIREFIAKSAAAKV